MCSCLSTIGRTVKPYVEQTYPEACYLLFHLFPQTNLLNVNILNSAVTYPTWSHCLGRAVLGTGEFRHIYLSLKEPIFHSPVSE